MNGPPELLSSEDVIVLSYAHMIGHVAVLGDQAKDEEFKALLWNTSKFLYDTMAAGYDDKLSHMVTEGGVN